LALAIKPVEVVVGLVLLEALPLRQVVGRVVQVKHLRFQGLPLLILAVEVVVAVMLHKRLVAQVRQTQGMAVVME
jgi:hypothetical protein